MASATSRLNGNHGTWVGTAVAAHTIFLFNNTSALIQSLQMHAPASVIPCAALGCPANLSGVAMIGSAPGAKLYALKVFPFNSDTTTTARILAAMDRAITLRRGLLDVPAASARLASGNVSSLLPVGLTTPSLALNLLPLGITPVHFTNNTYTRQLNNLKPGQMVQLYVPTLDNTDSLTVTIENVTPALPPAHCQAALLDARLENQACIKPA